MKEVLVVESDHDVFKISPASISYVPFDKLVKNLSFGFLICLAEYLVKLPHKIQRIIRDTLGYAYSFMPRTSSHINFLQKLDIHNMFFMYLWVREGKKQQNFIFRSFLSNFRLSSRNSKDDGKWWKWLVHSFSPPIGLKEGDRTKKEPLMSANNSCFLIFNSLVIKTER